MSRHAAHRVRWRRPWCAAGLVLLGAVLSSVGADALSRNPTAGGRSMAASVGAHALSRNSTAGGRSMVVWTPSIQAIRAVAPVGPAAIPVQVRIPSIAVDSALQALSLRADGSLEAPSEWQVAGWFRDGVRPGNPGPAVIAGHVDSRAGPAVFYRLRKLRAGDAVLVTRADHSVLRFVVDDIAQYRKDSFPAATVYGPQPVPVLRLITCTGDFDWTTHNYLDNLVVSAHLA